MIHSSSAQVVVEFSSPVPAWHLARSSASRVPVPQRPQWPAPRVHTIWDDFFGGDPPLFDNIRPWNHGLGFGSPSCGPILPN